VSVVPDSLTAAARRFFEARICSSKRRRSSRCSHANADGPAHRRPGRDRLEQPLRAVRVDFLGIRPPPTRRERVETTRGRFRPDPDHRCASRTAATRPNDRCDQPGSGECVHRCDRDRPRVLGSLSNGLNPAPAPCRQRRGHPRHAHLPRRAWPEQIAEPTRRLDRPVRSSNLLPKPALIDLTSRVARTVRRCELDLVASIATAVCDRLWRINTIITA